MSTIYTIANGKGGSGKTTTALHLSRYLAQHSTAPLVWGLDEIGGITRALQPSAPRPTGADVLAGRAPLQAAASQASAIAGVDVVPESPELREVADSLTLRPAGIFAIASALNKAEAWLGGRPIVLDTPGTLGTLTKAALLAATRLVSLADQVRAGLPPSVADQVKDPDIAAIIVVRFRHGVTAHGAALGRVNELAQHLNAYVGVVPLAEGRDADSRIAAAYRDIFTEMWGAS